MTRKILSRAIALTLVGTAAYYAIWGGEYTAFDLLRLGEQQEIEQQRIAQTRTEVDSLRLLVERLEDDEETLETVARERFGMIRDGELLYRFVEVAPRVDSVTTPLDPSTASE